jgi:uncharacterized protein YndB with AHSA1/START domain
MSTTITIAPVRKRISVAASQSHAFEVFTAGLGSWWPRRASVGPGAMKNLVVEPRVGGAWYEISEDGTRTDAGRIKLWDPPHRFVLSWDINHHWKPDTKVSSEVEVRFIAEGPQSTILELEHRNFEALGAEGGESMRRDVDNGWPGILDSFRQAAET